MSKTTSSETAQSAVSMLFAVGCGGEEELGIDPESMAVAYMKAFIECDTDAAHVRSADVHKLLLLR